MKKAKLGFTLMLVSVMLFSQTYPDPEFANEVYLLKKENTHTLLRLEKGSSKMDTKVKMGGFGGAENGYFLDNEKSDIRFSSGKNISFIFSNGASAVSSGSSSDSMLRANGIDPNMMGGMMGNMDPTNSITLFKAESEKGKRKVLYQKSPSAMPFASKKMKSSEKFTFSVKKIREGYWELVADKTLPAGEYVFVMMMMGSFDGESLLFAFGIDE